MSTDINEDQLSFCPVLFEILMLLKPKDILMCNFVNRRLHSVIRSKRPRLPRMTASLSLSTNMNEDNSKVDYVYGSVIVLGLDGGAFFAITDHRLRIAYRTAVKPCQLVRHYKENYKKCGDTSDYPDEAVARQISLKILDEETHFEDFEIVDQKKALRDLMSIVASQWNLQITLDEPFRNETSDEIRYMLGECIEEHRPNCSLLLLRREFQGIEEYCNLIKCRFLILSVAGSLYQFLGGFTKFERRMCVGVHGDNNYLSEIIDFMKDWQKGRLRIRKQLSLSGSFKWTNEELTSALAGCLQYTSARLTNAHRVEVLIRRRADDAVLCVAYKTEGDPVLYLYDVIHKGSLQTLRTTYS